MRRKNYRSISFISKYENIKKYISKVNKLWKNWSWLSRVSVQLSSVAQSCPTLWLHELQHSRPPCPPPIPRVQSNSHPSSQWCHPAISSSVIPFSSCPQSLLASESDTPVQKIVLTVKNLLTASQNKLSKWPKSI